MTGRNGTLIGSLLRDRHPDACEKDEQMDVSTVQFGVGYAVVVTEWCEECGAVDHELLDTHKPDPEEVARFL
ncbi:hypothetical protein BRD20_10205 [Halobacteriales archaeon SW_8_65_20]|nr:MAG: hypothetical protein BRD20_10205 [Halobacteriales archaeon SW_8_65_20]